MVRSFEFWTYISYDGHVYIQVEPEGVQGYGIHPRCDRNSTLYRMSLTLDENPANMTWFVETYRQIGPLRIRQEPIKECNYCYNNNLRFGRAVVAEEVCIPKSLESCVRFRFKTDDGLQPWSGLVIFKEGNESASVVEDGRVEEYTFIPNEQDPDENDCEIETLACDDDQVHILAEVALDDYPDETTWTLYGAGTMVNSTNASTTLGAMQASSWVLFDGESIFNGTNYTTPDNQRKTFVGQICAQKNSVYAFEIRDTYGDGTCCAWGVGYYNIYIDYQQVFTRPNARFGNSSK